jgi:hypothetical protein
MRVKAQTWHSREGIEDEAMKKVMEKARIIGNQVGQLIHRVSNVILKIANTNFAIIVAKIIIMKIVCLKKNLNLKGLKEEVKVKENEKKKKKVIKQILWKAIELFLKLNMKLIFFLWTLTKKSLHHNMFGILIQVRPNMIDKREVFSNLIDVKMKLLFWVILLYFKYKVDEKYQCKCKFQEVMSKIYTECLLCPWLKSKYLTC